MISIFGSTDSKPRRPSRRIKSDHPDIVIVIPTCHDSLAYQTAAEESGVEHLAPKDEWPGVDMIDPVQLILSDQKIDEHEGRRVEKHSREDSPYSGINFILPGHIKCFF
jgi:hypothetical protein